MQAALYRTLGGKPQLAHDLILVLYLHVEGVDGMTRPNQESSEFGSPMEAIA